MVSVSSDSPADSHAQEQCRVGMLLQLPPHLEQQFWSSTFIQTFLRCSDTIAGSLPFINMLLASLRRIKDVSDRVQLPTGARWMLLGYLTISLTTLSMLWAFPNAYKKHRMRHIILDRTWRLVTSALLMHPRSVLGYGTQTAAVGRAALSNNTFRALAVSVFAPTVMHLQQANLVLPFKLTLAFQVGNFILAVFWAQGMPCWLSATGTEQGMCSGLFGADLIAAAGTGDVGGSSCGVPVDAVRAANALQQMAQQACSRVQLLHILLMQTLPLPRSLLGLSTHNLCFGPGAFQVLFLYVAAVLMLVLPLTMCYLLERWAKLRWLQARRMQEQRQPWMLLALAPHSAAAAAGADADTEPSPRWQLRHALPLLILVLVQLPWVVAEVGCAAAVHMRGSCVPALAGPAFAWMQGMF